MDHVNTQVRHLELFMSKQSLDGGMQPKSNSADHCLGMGPVAPLSNSPGIVESPRPMYSNKTPNHSIFNGEEDPGKHEISFE